jgi:ribonuclease-3
MCEDESGSGADNICDTAEPKNVLTIDHNRFEELYALEYKISHVFNDIQLLDQALTHRSALTCNDIYSRCNERMEFLGDAVLDLVVSSLLYKEFPDYAEGQLTKLKAVVVSQSILTFCSRELGLGEYIRFSPANALEALIAAIYIDGGLKSAEDFIIRILSGEILELDKDEMKRDYKTALQEYWQASSQKPPVYKVVSEIGPDHDKRFEIEVILSGESYGIGIGRNKKEAEQKAAEKALETIFHRRRENDTATDLPD